MGLPYQFEAESDSENVDNQAGRNINQHKSISIFDHSV